jgi:hypothetical protein
MSGVHRKMTEDADLIQPMCSSRLIRDQRGTASVLDTAYLVETASYGIQRKVAGESWLVPNSTMVLRNKKAFFSTRKNKKERSKGEVGNAAFATGYNRWFAPKTFIGDHESSPGTITYLSTIV